MTYSKQRALELLELRDKATPGPWSVENSSDVFSPRSNGDPTDGHLVCDCDVDFGSMDNPSLHHEQQAINAQYIASAHDIADQLQAAVDLIDRLRRDCAEAYQVMGCVLLKPDITDKLTDSDIQRALDNISSAANGDPRPHDDLLPWPALSPEQKSNV